MTKRVIGITGGAGSGKTEVLRILENEYGARIIIADEVARELSSPGGKSYEKIVEAFGPEILMEDKNIDRPKLSAIVFHQPRLLETLNNIIHPNVREEIERKVREHYGLAAEEGTERPKEEPSQETLHLDTEAES